MNKHRPLLTAAALIAVAGCGKVQTQKGGTLSYHAGNRSVQVSQGENPNTPTTHASTHVKTREYTIPANSVVIQPSAPVVKPQPITVAAKAVAATPKAPAIDLQFVGVQLSRDMPVKETERDTYDTKLGAAQESGFAAALALRERFAAAKPILWVGLAVFVILGGALAYFGWWTKAIIAWVLGAALVVASVTLPAVNPLWFLGGAAAVMAVAGYMILHAYNSGKADVNQNGINDLIDQIKSLK